MKLTENGIAIIEGDTHISKWVEMTGRLDHDQNTLPLILEHIHEGMTVLDIGAFIGDHTIAYLKAVGEEGKVIAFECNPVAVECLKYNCPKAEVHAIALMDVSGVVQFELGQNVGASRIAPKNSNIQSISIPAITLDSLKFQKVDFIKIDVEGCEIEVIHGARETILRCKPIMVVELNSPVLGMRGHHWEELAALVGSLDYAIKPLMEGHRFIDPLIDILCIPTIEEIPGYLCNPRSKRMKSLYKKR